MEIEATALRHYRHHYRHQTLPNFRIHSLHPGGNLVRGMRRKTAYGILGIEMRKSLSHIGRTWGRRDEYRNRS